MLLADGNRGEDVRVAAANALGGIFDREPTASDAVIEALQAAGGMDGSLDLRRAALGALGRLDLAADARAMLLGGLR